MPIRNEVCASGNEILQKVFFRVLVMAGVYAMMAQAAFGPLRLECMGSQSQKKLYHGHGLSL